MQLRPEMVLLVGAGATAGLFGWIALLRLRVRSLGAELEARQSKLRAFAFELIRAEEEERARVARELHDGVGQMIAAIHLELEAVRQVAKQAAPPELVERIEDARTLASQLGTEVRRMSHELRPAILDELGLADALAALARRMSRPPELTVTLATEGNLVVLDGDLRTTLYRVVQESLTNVVRHSGARTAEVHVALSGGVVHLEVADDGRGFGADGANAGFGLTGLRERVAAIGGTLAIERSKQGGALVRAEIPYA